MSTKSSAKDSVLKYLKDQNRPYSANDITQNLHKEFGKTAIQKALDELSQDEVIREKTYGKQKVYAALQVEDGLSDMGQELFDLDRKIEDFTQQLKLSEQELKSNEALLKDLQTQLSTQDALKEKDELHTEVAKLRDRLKLLSNTVVEIPKKEKDNLSRNHEKFMKEYRKRKRICMDIADSILENYPKPKKALFEEVGVETDEEVGLKF